LGWVGGGGGGEGGASTARRRGMGGGKEGNYSSAWLFSSREEEEQWEAEVYIRRLDKLPARILRRIAPPSHKIPTLEAACIIRDGGRVADCFAGWRGYTHAKLAMNTRVVAGALGRVCKAWRRRTVEAVGVRKCVLARRARGARDFINALRVRTRERGAERAERAVMEAVRTRDTVAMALRRWRECLGGLRRGRKRAILHAWRVRLLLLPRFLRRQQERRRLETVRVALALWKREVEEERDREHRLETQGERVWRVGRVTAFRGACERARALRAVLASAAAALKRAALMRFAEAVRRSRKLGAILATASALRRAGRLRAGVCAWRASVGAAVVEREREGRALRIRGRGAIAQWWGLAVQGARAKRAREGVVVAQCVARSRANCVRALAALAGHARMRRRLGCARARTALTLWRSTSKYSRAYTTVLSLTHHRRAHYALTALARVTTLSRLRTRLQCRRGLHLLSTHASSAASLAQATRALRVAKAKRALRALRRFAHQSSALRLLSAATARKRMRETLATLHALARTASSSRAAALASAAAHARRVTLSSVLSTLRSHARKRVALRAACLTLQHTLATVRPARRALESWRGAVAEAKEEEALNAVGEGVWVRGCLGRGLRALRSRVEEGRAGRARTAAVTAASQGARCLHALRVWRSGVSQIMRVRRGAILLALRLGEAAEHRLLRLAWDSWAGKLLHLARAARHCKTRLLPAGVAGHALHLWRCARTGKALTAQIHIRRATHALRAWRDNAVWKSRARKILTATAIEAPRRRTLREAFSAWEEVSEARGDAAAGAARGLRVWSGVVRRRRVDRGLQ